MIKLLIETCEFDRRLLKLTKKIPDQVHIATYGIYAGITTEGRNAFNYTSLAVRSFLDNLQMNNVPTKILVGTYSYKSCCNLQVCNNCEKQYVRTLIRLLNHAEVFKQFEWRFHTECHLKYIIAKHNDSLTTLSGGRNLTGSAFIDSSFVCTDQKLNAAMNSHFLQTWEAATPLNEETISNLMEEQHITKKGCEMAVRGLDVSTNDCF